MDDYWEIYHGLDPVYGIYDLVLTRVLQLDDFAPAGTLQPLAGDPRLLPWVAGTPGMDPDNDGLVNDDEGVGLSIYGVPSHQTDPSPIWFTDALYPNSFTSLYYVRDADVWYWTPRDNAFPPSFAFDFEINEGYDTDKDFEADYDEVSGGSTDPTSEESPLKRRALYLPSGQDAYARTQTSYHWDSPVLRSFTVEAWVRPSDPATGEEQTIVERPFMVTVGNSMLLQPGIRFNFRLAVDGDGLPFVEYNGNGQQIIFVEAKAGSAFALKADEWTHLAGTYILPTDTARGRLVLYVNGEVAATFISDEIPAHGTFGTGGTVLVFFAPLVIGASDLNPSGEVSAFAFSQPSPTRYFSGWVDEVRVWDGARSQADVQATMMKHMRRSDLFAATSVRTTPLYVYSFDDLGDPDLDGVAPEGYSAMASASAPLDWPAIPFWAGANDKSLQYTEYRYLPVFANAMEHYPEVPPLDVGDTNVYTVTETVVTNTDSTVSTNVTLVMKYQNTANPYGLVYESSPLGGDYDIRGDLLPLRWAVADADVTMWDGGGAGTDDFDSDGDGLPDGWEEAYGMNPLGDAGADGAYGDPDQDGLVNIDEFEAGVLSPVMFDTLGNGYSDFYAWSGSVYRIFGELLTDVDGMADEWERLNALDPNLYDANQDADDDGWSNLAEFYAQTDPHEHYSVPQPSVQFLVSYTGLRSAGNLTINAYSDPDMDGPPDAVYDMSAIPSRSVYDEYIGVSGQVQYSGRFSNANIVPGSVLISHQSYRFSDVGGGILVGTWPGSSGTVDYSAGAYTLVFETPAPAGWNMSASYRFWEQAMTYPLSLTFTNTVSGYIREGDNWFFAYVDRNGDGTWNEEEPAGVQELRPFHVGWDAAYGIEIGLTDELPGYGRFSWEPVQDAAEYKVVVRDRSMPGSPLLFPARTIRAPRTYVHEQDFWQEGFFEGLGQSQSGFEWFVYRDGDVVSTLVASNSFVMLYDASLPAPTLVWPVGAKLAYARNEFRWRMDPNVTRVQVQISRESSFATRLMNVTTNAPFREVDGTYRFWLPTYAGYSSLTNGSYYWRVQASTPRATSAWSTASSFMVDLQDRTDGPYSVSGALGYFGKVTNGYFNVQAFRSRGWSGVPEAQVRIANTSSATNWPLNEFDFRIPGLKANTRYYVRAFLDQDGDRILDDHESRGFAEETYYEAKELQFPPSAVGIRVPVSLVDTDNDKIADDWEYQYFGDLLTAGPGPVNGYTDYDNNGISDYESYAASPMNISPMNYNSTGADGIPYWAKLAFNLDPWEYYGFLMTSIRPGVGGMPVVCWEAVGGSVQGMANGEALCVNNGVTVHYRLQYSPDLLTWSNVTSVNPVV